MDKTTVSIVKCIDYDKERVRNAIDQSFEYFGGIENVIKSGTKVLLKPNFIRRSPPETCTVTHPIVIETVAEKLLEIGAVPIIGDSPAFGSVARIAERIGIDRFARQHNIDIIELDEPRDVNIRCGDNEFPLTISGKALDVDAIINLPKLKAHVQFLYTAAVKNMYGCVSGKRKAWRHFKSNSDMVWYTEMLLANYLRVKPVFTIVDAVMAMERKGPSGGDPKAVSLIFGGIDCVAIDRVIADVINAAPSRTPLLKTAAKHKIGEQRIEKINIVGETVDAVKIFDFVLPRLIPVGFNIRQIVKSVVKHYWHKKFSKAT